MTVYRASWCAVLTIIVLAATYRDVAAQTQKVVFLPGLGEGPSNWLNMVNFLEDTLQLDGFRANFNTHTNYSQQADLFSSWLNGALPGSTAYPAVAHSNGGVVARVYRRDDGIRINKLFTIGTPHKGAPIARPSNINLVQTYAADFFNDAFMAFLSFAWGGSGNDPDPEFYNVEVSPGYYGWEFELDVWQILMPVIDVGSFAGFFELAGLLSGGAVPPANSDFYPESPKFNGSTSINGSWSETSKITKRVSMQTTTPAYIQPFLELTGNGSYSILMEAVHELVCSAAWSLFLHYSGHWDPGLSNRASRWLDFAVTCGNLHNVWTAATTDFGSAESDGLIPHWSSQYPVTGSVNRVFSAVWVTHKQQAYAPPSPTTQQLQYLNQYVTVLRQDFGISPIGGPLTVYISGPTVLSAGQGGTWNAIASGGTGSYSFTWSQLLSGSGPSISGTPSASGTLKVTVTSGSATKTATLNITVTGGGPPCCLEP